MATGVELGVALVGIVPVALELSRISKKYYRSFKRAPKEARDLLQMVDEFSVTLGIFCQTAQRAVDQKIDLAWGRDARKIVSRLVRMTNRSVTEIREIFQGLKALGNYKYPVLKRWSARIKWLLGSEEEVKTLMALLNTRKLDISLLLTLIDINIQLQVLEEKKRLGDPINKELLDRVILVETRYKILKRRYKEAIRERAALTASSVAPGEAGSSKFREEGLSFGHEVHDLLQKHMHTATTILDEIRRHHNVPPSTDTTATASTILPTSRVSPTGPAEGSRSVREVMSSTSLRADPRIVLRDLAPRTVSAKEIHLPYKYVEENRDGPSQQEDSSPTSRGVEDSSVVETIDTTSSGASSPRPASHFDLEQEGLAEHGHETDEELHQPVSRSRPYRRVRREGRLVQWRESPNVSSSGSIGAASGSGNDL